MLIAIDEYGSITLPALLRRALGLEKESYLELEFEDNGAIVLYPVSVHRTIQLNRQGIAKLGEARKSGTGEFPEWLNEEIRNAEIDTEQKKIPIGQARFCCYVF